MRFRRDAGLPLPAVGRGYRKSWLRGDLLAGVTVAAYLVPQVMAYARVAGLSPAAGLWAAVPALLIYAVLGSSRSLSLGPEATTALMTATAIGPLAAGDPARYASLAATLALLAGAMAMAAGLARLGFLADLLSRPVLVGYLSGVALIMIAGQLGTATGVPVTGEEFLPQVAAFASHLGDARLITSMITVAVLAFLFVMHARWPHAPGPLLAVLLATAAVAGLGLQRHGVQAVGAIPAGLPAPAVPALQAATVGKLALPAFSVFIVAFSDDVLTGRAFARRDEEIRPNRELITLGAANAVVSLVHGFPVSSSGSRTAIGIAAGSRTQLTSVTAALAVVAVLYALGPLLAAFPLAALAALVIYAATQLIDLTALRRLVRFRRSELVIAASAFLGVLTLGILYGVLVAIGVSVAELLVRVARPHDAILGIVPGLAGMHDIDDYPQARTIPGLVIYRYDAPLFFANAQDFRRRALAAARSGGPRSPARWFVLNVEANVEVDFTALEALDRVRDELARDGTILALARVKQDLLVRLQAFGLAKAIGPSLLFPTLPSVVDAYRHWAAAHPPPASPNTDRNDPGTASGADG
jgi:high affinity sulfate transporter 1